MDVLPADPTVPGYYLRVLARHPNYAVTGEPQWVASSLVRGMDSMPLSWDQ